VNSDSKKQTSSQGNRDWIATQSSTARNDDNDSGVSNTLSLNKISTNSVTTPTCQKQATSPQGEALENGAWFKFVYNKGEMRDSAQYRGRSGIIGYDLKLTDTKSYGLFFGHGNNTLDGFEDAWAKNKIEENKFGIYASRKSDKASGFLYFDYGKVDNELNRTLTNLNLSTNVKYKGDLFEIGGEYKLTPKNQKNKSWKVYPYVNLQFSRYKQDGYHENGGGIFNQVVESKTNNYAAGQLGLEFNFSNEKENYVLRLAGKRAFSGADPKLTFSFEGDMANKYELENEQDKNHLLVSFKGERKISTNTLLSADFSMQRGSHDRDLKASLSFWKRF
ncbi:MAG: autotransporter outer membrane beta-barrel domain-containing protein, partial [Candidatus Riflebacteria bacterium]|nr:autotransporter outer membrane beta-barrel domain-containing protein [Candidatus Riflebacteria bacterium]